MNYLRLFIACKLSKEILEKVSAIMEKCKNLDLDAKWVTVENLHLTLKFLGAVEPELLEKITKKLQTASRELTCFDLDIEGVGVFPRTGNPRVLWIGSGKGLEKMKELAHKIEDALIEFDIPEEEREFSAHITLARIKTSKNKEKLIKLVEENSNLHLGAMEVKYFTLFQSQLEKTGPVYSDLRTFMLKPK
ncbi:MAG: RNA 2',3'-cyclic phosphodiesterase [Armatimonadota bacterium]